MNGFSGVGPSLEQPMGQGMEMTLRRLAVLDKPGEPLHTVGMNTFWVYIASCKTHRIFLIAGI